VRNALRLTLGIAVSLACLYLATRGTDWGLVGAALAGAHPGWVAAELMACAFAIYLRAQRWRLMLAPVARVGLYPAFSATAIGFAATSVLPLRIGEIVRPALLGRRVGIGLSPALSSVVLERIFDMLCVISWFLVLSRVTQLDPRMAGFAVVLAAGGAVVFVTLLLLQRHRATAERLAETVFTRLPARVAGAARPILHGVLGGLGSLGSLASVARVVLFSIVLWTANGLPFLFAILALGLDVPLLPAALAVLVTVAAAVFVPQGPGFVGTWQYGCVTALALFHVPQEQAVGFSLLTWVVQMTVNVGLGGIFLAREDLSVRQLVAPVEAEGAR
jgi:glycosyltransferase 2 family protein